MTPRVAHLRALAASWSHELRALGHRPRCRLGRNRRAFLQRVQPWAEREQAIAGAASLAALLQQDDRQEAAQRALVAVDANSVVGRAVQLRASGLTLRAIAVALGIPLGTAKTWIRRARLGAQP